MTWAKAIFGDLEQLHWTKVISIWCSFLILSPILVVQSFVWYKHYEFERLRKVYFERFGKYPELEMDRILKTEAKRNFSVHEFKEYLYECSS